MNNILNFRYIGENVKSVNIKPNLIFRSASIDSADSNDIEELKKLEIKYIYDFRNENEKSKGDVQNDEFFVISDIQPLAKAKQYGKLAIEESTRESNIEAMDELYLNDFVTTTAYAEFFRSVLEQNTPQMLFHCTAGKDRTGVAGAIIMKILGCTDEEVYDEYLTIDPESIESVKSKMVEKFGDEIQYENIEPLLTVRKEYLDNFFRSVNENHGTFENYVGCHLMLESEDIKKLKDIYLV